MCVCLCVVLCVYVRLSVPDIEAVVRPVPQGTNVRRQPMGIDPKTCSHCAKEGCKFCFELYLYL